jgi:tetratricopeptide (TPR) repeat protein
LSGCFSRRAIVLQLAIGLLTTAAAQQPRPDEPVAVVLAEGASVRRANSLSLIAAPPGEVLFAGDSLIAERDGVELAVCPEGALYRLAALSVVSVSTSRLGVVSGGAPGRELIPECGLPRLKRDIAADQSHFGASLRPREPQPPNEDFPTRIARLAPANREELLAAISRADAVLLGNPGDRLARLSRAAVLDQYRFSWEALQEYRSLELAWPGVAWLKERIFHHSDQATIVAGPALPGRTIAVVVGVSEFQPGVTQLEFAGDDALRFASFLLTPRGGSVADLRLLVNAVSGPIRRALSTLRDVAGANDTVVIYIASHGLTKDGDGWILTKDSDPQDLKDTAVSMSLIQHLVERELSQAGRVIVYVDVCRSGTIGTLPRDAAGVQVAGNINANLFGFMASKARESSFESKELGAGVFTYFLLQALNGAADRNGDRKVHVDELTLHVPARVFDYTKGRQYPQFFGRQGNITDLADLQKPGLPESAFDRRPGALVAAARGQDTPSDEARLPAFSRFDEAIRQGRLLSPGALGELAELRKELNAAEFLAQSNRLRVELENRGQQVMLRYLAGEQIPQTVGQFRECAGLFEAALALTPESLWLDARLNFCRGRVAVFEKQYREAVSFLEQSIRFDPTGAYAYNALGIAYLESANYDRAAAAFQDAISRAPNWAYPRHNLALAHAQRGNYTAAFRAYREAMDRAPGAAYLPYNLGMTYQLTNRRREAEQAYRRALEVDGKHAPSYNGLGSLRALQGRREEAESLFRRALSLDPELLAARQNLAVLLLRARGRESEAIDLLEQNLAKPRNYLPSRLTLAKAYMSADRIPEAVVQYREAIRAAPESVAIRLELAELLRRSGQLDAARAELVQAAARQPRNPLIREQIGDLEAAAGHSELARVAYESALALNPDREIGKRVRDKLRRLGLGK